MQGNRPKIGVGVLISHNEQYLLMKRKGAHGVGTWAPPGGHLEFGESVVECAKREAFEETNLQIKNVLFLTITEDIFAQEQHYITLWVAAEYDSGILKNNEPEKCEDIGWFTKDQFPQELFLPFKHLLIQYPSL
jgi:8-oxo-dGTP diphosphatase